MSTATAVETRKPPSAVEQLAERLAQEIRSELERDALVWPSIPAVVVRVRRVMENPRSSADDIARAVGADPALAARLLKVANSVYYAGASPCKDLKSAVLRLGTDALEHAVLLLVVAQVFNVGKRRRIQPYLARLWRHSTLVASLSRVIAERVRHLETDVALLAGLVHDIGALPVLVRAEPVPKLLENRAVVEYLVAQLHCEVGNAMLTAWRFPTELVTVATAHEHLARDTGKRADYTDVVTAANILSRLGTTHRLAGVDWNEVRAISRLGLETTEAAEILERARAEEVSLLKLRG